MVVAWMGRCGEWNLFTKAVCAVMARNNYPLVSLSENGSKMNLSWLAIIEWVKRLFSPIKQALIRYSYVCQSRGAPVRVRAALSCWFFPLSRHIHRGVCLFHQMNERRSSWNHPTETMRPPHPIWRRDPCTCPLCPPLTVAKGEGTQLWKRLWNG